MPTGDQKMFILLRNSGRLPKEDSEGCGCLIVLLLIGLLLLCFQESRGSIFWICILLFVLWYICIGLFSLFQSVFDAQSPQTKKRKPSSVDEDLDDEYPDDDISAWVHEKGHFIFKCTACGLRITAPETMSGDYIECPKCNLSLRVPSNEDG